jgi:bifunctional DNA-binding transcriptional regulator/antitoxin component of YhaV-PrlF toxin-antitoxin module
MTQEVIVTRNGQTTLTKKIREKMKVNEGDKIVMNFLEGSVIISKKNPSVFRNIKGFLPKNFENTLKKMRTGEKGRLKELGLLS